MTEDQKDAIRADRLTMPGWMVGQKHSITRQRVDQIVKEEPNEQKRQMEREKGLMYENHPFDIVHPVAPALIVPFRAAKHRKFENPELQLAIQSEPPIVSMRSIASKYGIPYDAARRIRLAEGACEPARLAGRPNDTCSCVFAVTVKASTAEELADLAQSRGCSVARIIRHYLQSGLSIDRQASRTR